MKRLVPVCSAAGKAMALAIILTLCGCGQKQEPTAKVNSEGQAPAQTPRLQVELDRLAEIPYEQDPQRRPVLLSEAATNRREWLVRVLDRGYLETGRTNKQWDTLARAAFRAYADYSRAGSTE